MPTLYELALMARDFLPVVLGRDYFHHPQPLGGYFRDPRCYYNDLRGKVAWKGPRIGSLPALYFPRFDREVLFPVMVLQYGLGSIDRLRLDGAADCSEHVAAVAEWVVSELRTKDYLPSLTAFSDSAEGLYSDNSAMVQGQTLSFLVRVVRQGLAPDRVLEQARQILPRVWENMIAPVDTGGTALSEGDRLYFCEYCRKDRHVVLNGWIFALFGLLDYWDYRREDCFLQPLRATTATLAEEAASFLMASDWSRYDNLGRAASPSYHALHVHLFDALRRLFPRHPAFGLCHQRLARGLRPWNRLRFTLLKIKDKLRDRNAYVTQGRRRAA